MKKLIVLCAAACLVCMTACGQKKPDPKYAISVAEFATVAMIKKGQALECVPGADFSTLVLLLDANAAIGSTESGKNQKSALDRVMVKLCPCPPRWCPCDSSASISSYPTMKSWHVTSYTLVGDKAKNTSNITLEEKPVSGDITEFTIPGNAKDGDYQLVIVGTFGGTEPKTFELPVSLKKGKLYVK